MSFTRGKLYFSDESLAQRDIALDYTVARLSEHGIARATITKTIGVWNGETEYGFELETLTPSAPMTSSPSVTLQIQLEELAELIRSEFKQTSVLVTVETVQGALVFVEETNK